MQVPFVGMQPIRTSEHMASAGNGGIIAMFISLQLPIPVSDQKRFCAVCIACCISLVLAKLSLLMIGQQQL